MGHAYEKRVARAQVVQAEVGRTVQQDEPMSRARIEAFVRGFGLNAAQVKQIADRWVTDQSIARCQGYDSGQEDLAGYL